MKARLLPCCALALALPGCFSLDDVSMARVPLASHVEDWRDEVIYQVLVDRFANGNPANDWRVNRTSLARYQGGDWQGLIDQLPYFQALGVTTLWISPIVRNVDTDAGIDGYHGYWASDLAELNAHFGDLATLRRFVREAHARQLRVVVDIVTNHMGQMFYYDINQNGRPDDNVYGGGPNNGFQNPGGMGSTLTRVSEFDPDFNTRGVIQSFTSLGPAGPAPVVFLDMPGIFRVPPGANRACVAGRPLEEQPECNSWQAILAAPEGYHRRGRIVEYPNVNHQPGEQVLAGDFPGGLKDVNTEHPEVRAAMLQAYARWVELTDIDGFRIDTLKHVEHGFWQDFGRGLRERLARQGKQRFFLFGEAFDGDDILLGSYTAQNEMDSVFYFSQKFRVFRDVFQCEGATRAVEDLFNERGMHFGVEPQPSGAGAPPTQLLVNFFDNHDVPRFLAGILDEDPASCPQGRVQTEEDFQRLRRKLHAALAFLLTEDGIPCVYYGTEQDFRGANDPSNREVMWPLATDYSPETDVGTRFPTNGETFQHMARLTRIRRAYSPLRRGTFQLRWTTTRTGTEQDAGILAFERVDGSAGATVPRALVAMNLHGASVSDTSAVSMGGGDMVTGFAPGTVLTDVLATSSPRTVTVGPGGTVYTRLQPWETVILVPQEQVQPLAD